jgi:hypothetical protein
MKSFPIWLRLTAWYFLILAAILSVFGVTAYFAMRNSIHQTVDQDLQEQTQGIQRLMERTLSSGGEEELKDELREHSVLRPGGALMQVSDSRGNWLYRSAAMSRYNIPKPGETSDVPSTFVFGDFPLRLRNSKFEAAGQTFFIQIAPPRRVLRGLTPLRFITSCFHTPPIAGRSKRRILDEPPRAGYRGPDYSTG